MFDPAKYLPNPHDALQEPSHRWLRCRYLLEHSRSPSTQDDAVTREAWRFLRELRQCGNDADREQLARSSPALAEARGFLENAALLQRAELEARLLAGDSDKIIAPKCNLSAAAVYLFHELFFEVRPYLRAECYILNVAIGPKVHQGLRSDDHELLLKLAGYTLGAVAVDQLLAYIADPPIWPESLTQLDDLALEKLCDRLQMRAWILTLTKPGDDATSARLPVIQRQLAQTRALRQARAPDHAVAASQGTYFGLPPSMGCINPQPGEREAVPA